MTKRKTTEEFIRDTIKVHGYGYDLSEVAYSNNHTNVKVVCREHDNVFWQTPK